MSPAKTSKRVGPPVRDADGVTIHRPINSDPFRLRPDGTEAERGYYGPRDPQADQNLWADPPETVEAWCERTQAAEVALLLEALRDVVPTEYELRHLNWLCRGERQTVVVVASLLDRAYRAGLDAGRPKRRPAK